MTQCDVLSKRGRSARYSYNVYDTQGKPFMLRVNGKTDYFYLYNGLGDVTGLVDSSNQVVVRYQYNSWGKVTSTQDTSGVYLATLNPFRYRKYVYDPETGLYCLGSRYYDPEVGRFVNADDFETLTYQMDSVQGKNLYQYCFNNPVIYEDVVGKWPKLNSVFAAVEAVAAVVTVGTICVATAATVGITKTILAVKNQKKKEVVLLPKEKDLKREKLRKKPQNEQIKPRIQL